MQTIKLAPATCDINLNINKKCIVKITNRGIPFYLSHGPHIVEYISREAFILYNPEYQLTIKPVDEKHLNRLIPPEIIEQGILFDYEAGDNTSAECFLKQY